MTVIVIVIVIIVIVIVIVVVAVVGLTAVVMAIPARVLTIVVCEPEGPSVGVGGFVVHARRQVEMVDLRGRQRHAKASGGQEQGRSDQGARLHGSLPAIDDAGTLALEPDSTLKQGRDRVQLPVRITTPLESERWR
ncbi:hypothetical protein K9U40_14325 [Xanthobacter autotrophicus]|uniref:hypothetical protein n=1 Tax=Xanthobacter TaxID=279 RepID=UPI0024ABABFD|nr:hypothetical protein [Xanthobacter autotrophicus]MDI4665495.1 hypothetical protein [Xanthobacter autotrophicus]